MKLVSSLSRAFAKASSRWQNRLDLQLRIAARQRDPAVLWDKMAHLVDMGANINIKDNDTPLICSIAERGFDGVVTQMLAAGADPNAAGRNGETAFILAAWKGQPKTMAALADAGANMAAKMSNGNNALNMLVLGFGAVKGKDAEGRKNYHDAYGILSKRAGLSFKPQFRKGVFEGKKRKFAALDETLQRQVRLRDAVMHGHLDAARTLLAEGVDPNCGADCGTKPPLYFAVNKGKLDMVNALIAAGADVHRRFAWWSMPLELAAMRGHRGVFLSLVKAGADMRKPITVKRPDGSKAEMTLTDIALNNNQPAMAEFIQSLQKVIEKKIADVRTGQAVTVRAPLRLKKPGLS